MREFHSGFGVPLNEESSESRRRRRMGGGGGHVVNQPLAAAFDPSSRFKSSFRGSGTRRTFDRDVIVFGASPGAGLRLPGAKRSLRPGDLTSREAV